MKTSNLLFITTTILSLSACSSPENHAQTVIEDFCEAFKINDIETLKAISTDHRFIKFNFWTDADRKKTKCGHEIKKISDEKFLFMLGEKEMSMPIAVEKIEDEFKVTGLNM
ncbi:hypothetical protein [Thalassotalea sp. PLHSN55]|uniref:hypothetical protein n=1 Tax=Thalassotalea sp. PLHSN55 TaxID=3435888 RepID=UPI003F864F85